MQSAKFFVTILATASLAVVSASSIFGHDTDFGLLSYMARANNLLQQDPARSLDCFNKYIPLINAIASNYETNFKACLNESEAASAKADEATLEQRDDLANAAEASCALLKQCQENDAVEGIFQCYIEGGSTNLHTMYTINANASQELAALREQFYLIKNSEYKCTNETKRVYEKNSAEAYAGLNNCILGNDDVTKEPSTTATSTTDTTIVTTSAVPESSESPTTTTVTPESPATTTVTTESPQTTTAVPETTEKTPEETTTENPETTTAAAATEDTTSDNPKTTAIEPETSEAVPEESTSESPIESDYYYI